MAHDLLPSAAAPVSVSPPGPPAVAAPPEDGPAPPARGWRRLQPANDHDPAGPALMQGPPPGGAAPAARAPAAGNAARGDAIAMDLRPDGLDATPELPATEMPAAEAERERARLELLFNQADTPIFMSMVAALALGSLLAVMGETMAAVLWTATLLAIEALRLTHVLAHRGRLATVVPPRVERLFVGLTWASATAWAALGWLDPSGFQPGVTVLNLLIPLALAGVALITIAASAAATVGTVVILTLGMLAGPALAAGSGPLVPGLIVMIAAILMTGAIRQAAAIAHAVALDQARRSGLQRVHRLSRTLIERSIGARQMEDALTRSDHLFRTLAEVAPVGLWQARPDGRLAYVNGLGRRMLGLSMGDSLPDQPWFSLLHHEDRDRIAQAWREATAAARVVTLEARVGATPDDRWTTHWLLIRSAPMTDDSGVWGVAGTMTDISEAKAREQSLAIQATTDDLTGLINRGHFFALAQRELDRALRYQRPLAVVALDLDHFKRVNDTWGHEVGDRVLKAFADRARRVLRNSDLLGRTGGEEFMLCLPECGREGAESLAERLRQTIEAMSVSVPGGGDIRITISLGVALRHDASEPLPSLLRRADMALYQAKNEGRNRWCLAPPASDSEFHTWATAAMAGAKARPGGEG